MQTSGEENFNTYIAKRERASVLANAEAFHKETQGIDEPTSAVARRYLATKYPTKYPQWAYLTEAKGAGTASATQGGKYFKHEGCQV